MGLKSSTRQSQDNYGHCFAYHLSPDSSVIVSFSKPLARKMIYDVAIIGAGPCGLAAAARLREATPSALFTDDEHERYWRRFKRTETIESEKKKRRRKASSASILSEPELPSRSMVVLDGHSNQWMSAWKERFKHLQIDHLRSPLFFHPDPRDRDGLLGYSHFHDRAGELREIHNVVGRELSKHRTKKKRDKKVARHLRIDDRDRVDYFTPSTRLFDDFCQDIIHRYQLQDLIVQAQVQNIEYGDVGSVTDPKLFALTTDRGTIFSKTVVLAVGPGAKPKIPSDCQLRLDMHRGSVCHCFEAIGSSCMPEHVSRKINERQPTSVVVVGGGLTSAQIADLLLSRGVTKVFLLLRGKYKLKHFDVDLEWVSKVRNQQMAVFWSADTDEERFEMLKMARNGGSITPSYDKILKKHVANGVLRIVPHTCIEDGTWCCRSQTWTLWLSSASDSESVLSGIDHVIYATGAAPNINNVSCMQRMLTEYPVESINGLARVTDDLMWQDDVPLFLTGGLAGLRLGPGAANLAGARQGAERIAWKIDEILGRPKAEAEGDGSESGSASTLEHRALPGRPSRASLSKDRSEFTGSFNNQFEALSI
ncbi:hypothetical protein PV08_00607 [Exophiala spinifera]|uniref:FAD/NAD(P)-binding domain-containing protein n=1 Tax=Exophiala spinifera TaxID=91928 RepID=A0A0D2A5L1_9EURO|nr:uncharacterized protein PV08_00607 [Exophiala spinifera]KIW20032.1 hypothetical protein PV08_00607 [Exophiala spinifera]